MDQTTTIEQANIIPEQYQASHKVQQAFMNQTDPSLIIFFHSFGEKLKELEHTLKGEVPNYKTKQWERISNSSALLTDEGVAWVLLQLQSRLDTGTFMSKLEKDEISFRARRCSQTIIDGLFENMIEYKIKTISDYFTILAMVDDKIFCALSRALDGGERGFLGKSIDVRQISTMETRKKKSFFDFLKLPT